MSLPISRAAVCFLACHGGPADHFATFHENLIKEGIDSCVYATGPALDKFKSRKVGVTGEFQVSSPEEEDKKANEIARSILSTGAKLVITDVGHPFSAKIQKALAVQAPNVERMAYYDNPEAYVPGGYSQTASEVMSIAKGVIFANANLSSDLVFRAPGEQINFGEKKKFGLGYYPVEQALKLKEQRECFRTVQAKMFKNNNVTKTTLVYFGGNNEEYFSKAFPAFLSYLTEAMNNNIDLSHLIIRIQQHPGAKDKKIENLKIHEWQEQNLQNLYKMVPKFIISSQTSDEAQVVADAALYYQTSMGPQFCLAGIPTVQIAHEKYEDILVKNGLCQTVTNGAELVDVFQNLKQ